MLAATDYGEIVARPNKTIPRSGRHQPLVGGRFHHLAARLLWRRVSPPPQHPPPPASKRIPCRSPSSVRRDNRFARHRPRTDHSPRGRRSAATARSSRCSSTAETSFRRPRGSLAAGTQVCIDRYPPRRFAPPGVVAGTWVFGNHHGHCFRPFKTRLKASVPPEKGWREYCLERVLVPLN
jgi:hypothetical protein